MRLTTFTDYSLRVLIYLAAYPDRRATIAEVSRAFHVSESHVAKVVQFLGAAGWLENSRGRKGGMRLAVNAAQIIVAVAVDGQVEALRTKYAAKISAMQERIRRAQQSVDREKAQANQAKLQTAISLGTTLVGALLGRKTISRSTLGSATTAVRGVGRSMKEQEDIGRASESVEALQGYLAETEAQLQSDIQELEGKSDPNEAFETINVKPKKTNISVQLLAFVWAPYWNDESGKATPAWE